MEKGKIVAFQTFEILQHFRLFWRKGRQKLSKGFWVLTTSILVEIVLSLKTENFLTDAMQKVIGGEGQIFDPIEKFQWFQENRDPR